MIKVLTVSDDWHHFEKPIMEYQKRLMKTCDFVTLKPSRARLAKQIIDEETEKIITVLEKYRGFVILCDEFGKTLTSPALSQFLATLQ